MIDLEIYTDKIAESGRRLIRKAYEEARSRDHNQLAPEHVFVSIAEVERPFFNEVMQSLNLDPQVVLQALETKLGQRDYLGRGMKISESLRTLLSNALKHSHERGRRLIESTDLFVALFKDVHSFPVEMLQAAGRGPRDGDAEDSDTRPQPRRERREVSSPLRTSALSETFRREPQQACPSGQAPAGDRSQRRDTADDRDPLPSRTRKLAYACRRSGRRQDRRCRRAGAQDRDWSRTACRNACATLTSFSFRCRASSPARCCAACSKSAFRA